MTRAEKEKLVAEMTAAFKESNAIVVCDYKGMTCKELESVRKMAAQNDVFVRVVKNTLASIALKNAEIDDLELKDTNLIVWGEDQISTCKTADKAATAFKGKFTIKAGALEGQAVELDTIMAMAKLPSRDELRGSTWMVLVAVGMLGGFTFLADWLLGGFLIQDVLLKWIGTGAVG